jgi:hypothetical protein
MLAHEDLRTLAGIAAAGTVSIYLPTHKAGREIRQDPIRLKKLLDDAVEQLMAAEHRRPDAEALLEPARALLADEEFWRFQERGLALFAAPGFFRCEKLPLEPEELVVVAPRLHLRPLFPQLTAEGEFLILAVTAAEARLLHATRAAAREMAIELPAGVAEISAETDYQTMRHAAPPARPRSAGPVGMPATHNFGEDPEEQRKAQMIEYLRRVINAIEPKVAGRGLQIVLAGQPEAQGHVRALAKNLPILEAGIDTNPDSLSPEELHARALELVRPVLDAGREHEMERLAALLGSGDGRASVVPDEIVKAARHGRVATVFLARDEHLWGSYAEDEERIVAHGTPSPDDEDLLDRAAVETLLHGGRVELLPREALPRGSTAGVVMAAVMRY